MRLRCEVSQCGTEARGLEVWGFGLVLWFGDAVSGMWLGGGGWAEVVGGLLFLTVLLLGINGGLGPRGIRWCGIGVHEVLRVCSAHVRRRHEGATECVYHVHYTTVCTYLTLNDLIVNGMQWGRFVIGSTLACLADGVCTAIVARAHVCFPNRRTFEHEYSNSNSNSKSVVTLVVFAWLLVAQRR